MKQDLADAASRPCRFLSLPLEIRFCIYDHIREAPSPKELAGVPVLIPTRPWRTDSEVDFMITRESLFYVCKQIRDEWAPFYYKDAGIHIDDSNQSWRNLVTERDAPYSFLIPMHFETTFLREVPLPLLRNLRKLDFDITTTYNLPNWKEADYKGAIFLAGMLDDNHASLPSLEQVVIRKSMPVWTEWSETANLPFNKQANWIWHLATRSIYGFPDGWDTIEKTYGNESELAMFQGWQAQRAVEVSWTWDASRSQMKYYVIEAAGLMFRKVKKNNNNSLSDGETKPAPELIVTTFNPIVDLLARPWHLGQMSRYPDL